MKNTLVLVSILFGFSAHVQNLPGIGYKPIIIQEDYNHTKWGVEPGDLIYHFAAFTSSFDSDDDDNGDGINDIWGVPEWVAYEVKSKTHESLKYNRPKWMTDDQLNKEGVAPNDETYAVSGTNDLKEVSGDYRFVRGHMCPKDAADRISADAGYNTHTVINAVPQLQWQNNGIWRKLEADVTVWADKYKSVWVICGPIFFNKTPSMWLGQNDEVKAAIADAFYKIVIRKSNQNNGVETLSFIIPNVIPKEKKEYAQYLTSMERVELLSGLRFLTTLDAKIQVEVKSKDKDLDDAEKIKMVEQW